MGLYTKAEEIANSITHGLGLIFAILALTALMYFTYVNGTTTQFVSYLIYGLSMILVFLASTLYHAITHHRTKQILQICDHASIYIFIAGCYTPFLMLNVKGTLGWVSIAIVWAFAICGVIFKIFFTGKFERLSTMIYHVMGWMALLIAGPLFKDLSTAAIVCLFAGGAAYTIGTVFFMLEKKYFHAIWHVFVLLGCIFHFTAVVYAAGIHF